MNCATRTARGHRGFTLIEVMIATAILGIALSAIYRLMATSQSTYITGTTMQHVQDQARKVLDAIAFDLRQARASTIVITPNIDPEGDQSIAFEIPTGYVAGAVTWGPVITYSSIPSDGELQNGVDDNSDGLIDERKVTRLDLALGALPVNISDYMRSGSMRFTPTLGPTGLIATIQIDIAFFGVDDRRTVLSPPGRSVTVQIRNQQ